MLDKFRNSKGFAPPLIILLVVVALAGSSLFLVKVASNKQNPSNDPTPLASSSAALKPTQASTQTTTSIPKKTNTPTSTAKPTTQPTSNNSSPTSTPAPSASLNISLNCVDSDSAMGSKHVDYTVSATVGSLTDTGIWTTLTDEKEGKTIIWQGSGYTSNFSGSGHEVANSIRGSGQVLFIGDGRNYTVKLYRETYSNETPSLSSSPIAQASSSKNCN